MNDEQINQRIAEACGWKLEKHFWLTPEGCEAYGWDIPDYCNDLNEMHEAEKVLTVKCFNDYVMELLDFIDEPILATARQRAEAFLRTLGKWEEAQA